MLNVVLWGGLLFLLMRRWKGTPLFPWLVLAVSLATCLMVAYGAGVAVISVQKFVFLFGQRSALFLKTACWSLAVAGVSAAVSRRRWLAKRYLLLPLLFSPFLLMTFGQSLAAVEKVEASAHFLPHSVKPQKPLQERLGRRVVWIIFDETDYRLCFAKRPPNLSLPAFDRFQQGALWASRAYSPNDNTQTSLPSLLTGLPLQGTVPKSAGRMELVHAGTLARSDFSSADTIFTEVKKRGGSTALFGWYLPYSRVLPNLDLCRDYYRYNVWTSTSLLETMLTQWREIADFRFLPFNDTLLGKNQIGIVRHMTADVAQAVREHDPTLLFLHYSVPHSPNVYDRRSVRFGFNRDQYGGYFDNIALADRCLAELRGEMERKGTWDDSLVIVSSDHHWRTNTYDRFLDKQHVPFMVKFPHQKKGFPYQGKFNTVLTKDLILQIMDGKIASPQEAASWLDKIMHNGKTPVAITVLQPDAD